MVGLRCSNGYPTPDGDPILGDGEPSPLQEDVLGQITERPVATESTNQPWTNAQ